MSSVTTSLWWSRGDTQFRLEAQGEFEAGDLLAIAASVGPADSGD